MSGWEDEHTFASPSGLPPGELAETLARSVVESGRGVSAAVELLRRSGDWLEVLDAAGFVAIGPPSPRNPEPDPPARSIVRWAEAVAALEHPGVLADAARPHRRPHVLRLAAGLAGGVPVDLRAVLDGLHRDEARLVLAAISAATQGEFAEYEQRLPDGRDSGWSGAVDLGPLVPWPDPEPADLGEQPELDLFPARVAEERALAWALAHPAPSVSLPLDTNVRAVLDHLRFASGMRGHGLGRSLWRTEPVLEGRVVRADEEVAAWAGIDVPEITTPWAHRRICTTPGWARGDEERPVTVHWIPVDADAERFTGAEAEALGAPELTIELDREHPDPHPDLPRTSFTRAPGGWTAVTLGRSVVGVQRIDPEATRIGWVRPDLPQPLAFVLHVPLLPTPAVELVLRSPGLPFAR